MTANLLYLPIGGKLKTKSEEEARNRYMQLEGILSIQAGENPGYVHEGVRLVFDLLVALAQFEHAGHGGKGDHRGDVIGRAIVGDLGLLLQHANDRETDPADFHFLIDRGLAAEELLLDVGSNHDHAAALVRPVKELKGFRKIMIKAGESKDISFSIKSSDLAFYTKDMTFKAEPGDFKVFVGTNSVDCKEAAFTLME